MVETADDRLIMLSDFGVDATYTPDGGSPSTIKTIFLNEYYSVDAGTVGMEMSQPIAVIRTADAPNLAHNDTFVISAITYKAVNVRPDGTGMTEVALEEQ
jgi:hypothetical protein